VPQQQINQQAWSMLHGNESAQATMKRANEAMFKDWDAIVTEESGQHIDPEAAGRGE